MPFDFEETKLPGVILVKPKKFVDERGYFQELYKDSEFVSNGIDLRIKQINQSFSKKNVLRGLHFQKEPYAQGKLVNVVQGSVYDVAIDIRKSSPAYGEWVGFELNDQNNYMLWIPPGFAHGFLNLEDNTFFQYLVTENEYKPNSEGSYHWNSPQLAINWPIEDPILNDKDRKAPLFQKSL